MLDVEVVVVVTMRAGNAGNVEGRENSVRFHYLCFERGWGEQHSEQSCQMSVLWLSCFPELLWEGLGSD